MVDDYFATGARDIAWLGGTVGIYQRTVEDYFCALQDAGHDVHGLYMSNWDDDDDYCPGAQDFQDARAVAAELDIPLHRVSFAADYRDPKKKIPADIIAQLKTARLATEATRYRRQLSFGLMDLTLHTQIHATNADEAVESFMMTFAWIGAPPA